MPDLTENETVQQALRDLQSIRSSIQRFQTQKKQDTGLSSGYISLIIQIGLFSLSSLVLIFELLSNGLNTRMLFLSQNDANLRIVGIVNLGLFLACLCYALYFIMIRAAKRENSSVEEYVAKHFFYLRNLALFSDLFLKFVIFSAFILAGKPQWISPLLLLFTADYLAQGRLFTFSVRSALLLALLCNALAFWLFYMEISQLSIPLAIFAGIAALSSVASLIRYKRLKQELLEEKV